MRNLMSDLRNGVLGVCVISMGLGVSVPAQAASANGPYYAVPSWDQKLPADTRFIVLSNWNNEAVLDRETGLVWERSPSTSTFAWQDRSGLVLDAQLHCNGLSTGGRLGWRLPTLQELASLADPTVPVPGPALPSGHPFSNVQSTFYWSATTFAGETGGRAWGVRFNFASVGAITKSAAFPVWCVRGGPGLDPQ